MDACDGPMPGEEPLPPPEKPVVVKDNTHTKAPTTDRGILAQCIEELAIQVKCALDNDSINNKRYARRMRLENRIRHTEGKGREDYPIVLPIAFNSWNDVNIEELEYRIIMAVNNQDNKHVWYHVRILFDDFIDPQTKDYLEQLDRGEDLSYEEAIPQLGPSPSNQQSSHSNTPLASSSTRSSNCQSSHSNTPVASTTPARSRNHQSTHNSPVTSTSKSSPQPSTSTSSSAPSSSAPSSSAPKKMRAPVVTIDVEGSDDEDIMILN